MANNSNNGSTKKAESKEELAKAAAKASANKQSQSRKSQGKKKGGLIAYLKGVRQEFKKVVWPTREELTTNTIVVFACVIFFALAFWLIDTGFLAALKGILGITLS